MTNNYSVYMHIAENKVYIGITTNITARWQRGHGYRSNAPFNDAIKRIGWSNITHTIIADSLTKQEAQAMESALIAQYDSTNPEKGYNRDFSEFNKFVNSAEQIELRKANCKTSKQVEQLGPDNQPIATFRSISEAARAVGGSFSALSAHLHGKTNSFAKFKWRFKNDDS